MQIGLMVEGQNGRTWERWSPVTHFNYGSDEYLSYLATELAPRVAA